MEVPSASKRKVGLGRNPVFVPVLALARAPPRLGAPSPFVAAPAAPPVPVAAERHGARMFLVQEREKVRFPIVIFRDRAPLALPAVHPAVPAGSAIRAVKPDLADFTVVVEKLVPLREEIVDIGGRGVVGLMTVPRREIDPELHPLAAARLGRLTHKVATGVRRGDGRHRVVEVVFRRPQAETVMVLRNEHHALDLRRPHRPHPLRGIEPFRRDPGRRHVAETPLLIRVRVQTPAHERHNLPVLIFKMRLRGQYAETVIGGRFGGKRAGHGKNRSNDRYPCPHHSTSSSHIRRHTYPHDTIFPHRFASSRSAPRAINSPGRWTHLRGGKEDPP